MMREMCQSTEENWTSPNSPSSLFDLTFPPTQNWTSLPVDLTTAASPARSRSNMTRLFPRLLHWTDGMLISARAYGQRVPGRAGMLERDNGQPYSWRRNVEPGIHFTTHTTRHGWHVLCQSGPGFLACLEWTNRRTAPLVAYLTNSRTEVDMPMGAPASAKGGASHCDFQMHLDAAHMPICADEPARRHGAVGIDRDELKRDKDGGTGG